MIRALLFGTTVLLTAYGMWTFVVGYEQETLTKVLVFPFMLSPAVAACLSAYLAPRKKVLVGMSMSIVAAVLAVITNSFYQLTGAAADYSGLQGTLMLFLVTLIEGAALCAIGTAGGLYLSKHAAQRGI